MALTVLLTAYSLAPVSPDAVGGSEQVLCALDRALAEAGHRSLVAACEGSRVRGRLFPVPAPPVAITQDDKCNATTAMRAAICTAMQEERIDLIHAHGLDWPWTIPGAGVPLLATLHLPPSWYPGYIYELDRPATWLNCVSHAQTAAAPSVPYMLPPVPNGVPVAALARGVRPERGDYALCLARVCPEKGLHLALDAAHRAGVPLVLAGEVFPYEAHQRYFEDEIAPRLDAERRYVGPVGFAAKRRLLAGARCLLVPSLVPETSSLVAMEAAATGTPVIAFPAGALPEVVEHGRTGLIVDDLDGLAAALGPGESGIGAIRTETCRAVACERFSLERMTGEYIARYERLVAQTRLASLVKGIAEDNRHVEVGLGPAVGNEVW